MPTKTAIRLTDRPLRASWRKRLSVCRTCGSDSPDVLDVPLGGGHCTDKYHPQNRGEDA